MFCYELKFHNYVRNVCLFHKIKKNIYIIKQFLLLESGYNNNNNNNNKNLNNSNWLNSY